MYTRKSRLTPHKQGRQIEHFVVGTTVRAAIEVVVNGVFQL